MRILKNPPNVNFINKKIDYENYFPKNCELLYARNNKFQNNFLKFKLLMDSYPFEDFLPYNKQILEVLSSLTNSNNLNSEEIKCNIGKNSFIIYILRGIFSFKAYNRL